MHKVFTVKANDEEVLSMMERIVQEEIDVLEFKKVVVKVCTNFIRENDLNVEQGEKMKAHLEGLVFSKTIGELQRYYANATKTAEEILGYTIS